MLVLDMTSNIIRLVYILIGVVLIQAPLSSDIPEKVLRKTDLRIAKEWPGETVSKEELLPHKTDAYSAALLYTIGNTSQPVAFAIVGKVASKSNPVCFLLLLDSSLSIQSLELPALMGSKNAPLRSRFWRRQFVGGSVQNQKINEVDAISGATISSDAIKEGVLSILNTLATSLQ